MLALVLAGAGFVATGVNAGDDVGTQVDEILADERYQTELPGRPESLGPPLALGGLGLVLWIVLLAGAAVTLLVVVALVVGALRRAGPDEEGAPDDDTASRARRAGLLPSAREAAAAGRLDEAVHLLLLHALDRLARRTTLRPDPAETTRELVHRIPLDGDPRRALGELVRDVELTHFGGRPATAERFERCARQFRTAVGEDVP